LINFKVSITSHDGGRNFEILDHAGLYWIFEPTYRKYDFRVLVNLSGGPAIYHKPIVFEVTTHC